MEKKKNQNKQTSLRLIKGGKKECHEEDCRKFNDAMSPLMPSTGFMIDVADELAKNSELLKKTKS